MKQLELESYDGGRIDVIPVRLVSTEKFYSRVQCCRAEEHPGWFPLGLEEYAFLSLLIFFMDKYLERSILNEYRYDEADDTFDYYSHNLYRYVDVLKMLDEIEHTAYDILHSRQTDIVTNVIQHFNPRIFDEFACKVDRQHIFSEHRQEIADYYFRFCSAINAIMNEAPEFELLDFWGP